MSAVDDANAALEAALWHITGISSLEVDGILILADAYADVVAQEAIAANLDIKAIGAQRLTEASNEASERKR